MCDPGAGRRSSFGFPLCADEADGVGLPDEEAETDVDEAVASWPRLGRHLVFDGRLLHGAPASLAAPPPAGGRGKGAARSEAPRKRISFLVNRPPQEAEFELVRQEIGGRAIRYSTVRKNVAHASQ